MKLVLPVCLLLLLSACATQSKKNPRNPASTPSPAELEMRSRKMMAANLNQKIDIIQYAKEAIICSCNKTTDNAELSNQVGFLVFTPANATFTTSCSIPSKGRSETSCDDFQVIR